MSIIIIIRNCVFPEKVQVLIILISSLMRNIIVILYVSQPINMTPFIGIDKYEVINRKLVRLNVNLTKNIMGYTIDII